VGHKTLTQSITHTDTGHFSEWTLVIHLHLEFWMVIVQSFCACPDAIRLMPSRGNSHGMSFFHHHSPTAGETVGCCFYVSCLMLLSSDIHCILSLLKSCLHRYSRRLHNHTCLHSRVVLRRQAAGCWLVSVIKTWPARLRARVVQLRPRPVKTFSARLSLSSEVFDAKDPNTAIVTHDTFILQ